MAEGALEGVRVVDLTRVLAGPLGAMAARQRTGTGQRIELSLHDTGLQMLANVAANHLVSGADAALAELVAAGVTTLE